MHLLTPRPPHVHSGGHHLKQRLVIMSPCRYCVKRLFFVSSAHPRDFLMLVRFVTLAILATAASAFAPSPASLSLRSPPHAATARSSLSARPAPLSGGRQRAARLAAGGGLLGLRAGVETDALQGVEVVNVASGQVVPAARKTGKVREPTQSSMVCSHDPNQLILLTIFFERK